eukprot:TRINITY_DN4740_c0_g1_i2.p1 TRINITY_DN4740_c0_g1~~TRINITY_DN4740_c0_g1_i2.p1  ORF type:complete len:452 (+),score=140.29 TRINITY_DN4740_c0_g1_i2:779-2134(+)
MDLVVNHSSDEHPWFIQSRSSKSDPHRDWYIWKPANAEGKEPTNWLSFFSGSTWEFDENSREYYLHLFSKKQPDLNWENPKLRNAVYDMMHFWLKRGIDGFRMDVINLISKKSYEDAKKQGEGTYHWGGEFFFHGPKMMEYLLEMKEQVLSKYDIMSVGETPGASIDEGAMMTKEDTGPVNMLFQFELMDVDTVPGHPKWDFTDYTVQGLKEVMDRWETGLAGKGWNSLYVENHDQPRSVSRFGDPSPQYHALSAKMLATWLHFMQGTPYVYQGQEIGMTNVKFSEISEYRDLELLNFFRESHDKSRALESIYRKGRDNARTPFQWNSRNFAGFSTKEPWIKINPNYTTINAESQQNDPHSILAFYKKLIALRKKNAVMVYGDYVPMECSDQVYAYGRKFDSQILTVYCNFSGRDAAISAPQGEIMLQNYEDMGDVTHLRPWEARVFSANT